MEIPHSYPEWKRHETAIAGGATRVPMDYLDFLEDPTAGVNLCHALSSEEREARRQQLKETAARRSFTSCFWQSVRSDKGEVGRRAEPRDFDEVVSGFQQR